MKKIKIANKWKALMASFILASGVSFAQDGAKLFKQNCAACHKIDEASVGPALKGAKEKWDEAGEGELIYRWVANPQELYDSGESKMAKEIWDFSPAAMSPMAHLSREEVDAIFNYIANPPAPEEPKETAVTEETVPQEEASAPLASSVYVMMIAIILILLIAVIVLGYGRNTLNGKHKAKKSSNILTKSVAVEDEDSILLDHEYDGIRELDNVLPPWWVWGFYFTIAFAIIYTIRYHIVKSAPLQDEAYVMEVTQADKDIDAYKKSAGMNIDETNVTLLTDQADLDKGATIFAENCAVCHNPDGEGNIGPNLSDKYWLHGGDIKDIFKTIKYGVDGKGMPEHQSKLNPIQLQEVASYIKSLKFHEGKEPEGELVE